MLTATHKSVSTHPQQPLAREGGVILVKVWAGPRVGDQDTAPSDGDELCCLGCVRPGVPVGEGCVRVADVECGGWADMSRWTGAEQQEADVSVMTKRHEPKWDLRNG
jgi:hypothetical protein